MTDTVQTLATAQSNFADGQAAGSITPSDVRNLAVSVPSIAASAARGLIYNAGNFSTSGTLNWVNGSIQVGTLTSSSVCTLTLTALALPAIGGATVFASLNAYIINNSSGNGTLAWSSNVTWIGSTPQPNAGAGVVTKFRLESLDGGNNWSVVS